MTEWHWWVAGWVGWVLNTLFVVAVALGAIWLGSERLAGTAGLLGGIGFVTLFPMIFWTMDAKPNRPLPYRQRKKVRDEARRIELEATIKRLEIENGLREPDIVSKTRHRSGVEFGMWE